MQIKELQQRTGVHQKMIQFYEEQQLIQATILDNGFHEYDEAQVSRLKEIKMLRALDIPFDDIRMYYMDDFYTMDQLMAKHLPCLQSQIDELQFKKNICYQLQRKGELEEEQVNFLEEKKHPSWKSDFLELRMLYLSKDQKDKQLFQFVSIWLLAGLLLISALPSFPICMLILVCAMVLTLLSLWKPNVFMDIYLAVLCFIAVLEDFPTKFEQRYAHVSFIKRRMLAFLLLLICLFFGVFLLVVLNHMTNHLRF